MAFEPERLMDGIGQNAGMGTRTSDLAAACIRCGFCLESCPTYLESGLESESPRGRIYLAKHLAEGTLERSDSTLGTFDRCLGCRACETACPSDVKYGQILAETLEPRPERKMALATMSSAKAIALATKVLGGAALPRAVSRIWSLEDAEAQVPVAQAAGPFWPPMDRTAGEECVLLEGCAAKALYPRVQEAAERLLARVGLRAVPIGGCCGALHAHSGMEYEGRKRLDSLANSVAGRTAVSTAGGCGSWMKESDAIECHDITEVLFSRGLVGLLQRTEQFPTGIRVVYHAACHLAHAQKVRDEPLELLTSVPGLQLVTLAEGDMCCGSAGTYNLRHPDMARALLERKWRNILESGADAVATGNPGCLAWIEQKVREEGSHIKVLHTAELLESAFSGWVV